MDLERRLRLATALSMIATLMLAAWGVYYYALKPTPVRTAVEAEIMKRLDDLERATAVKALVLELCKPGPVQMGRVATRLDALTDRGKNPVTDPKVRRWLASVKKALLDAHEGSGEIDAATADRLRREGLDCVP